MFYLIIIILIFVFYLIDILKAHEGAITQMIWIESNDTLITASKDKRMKVIL